MLFNNQDGTFSEFTDEMPVDMHNLYTSGVAHADYDGNGFSDLLIVAERVPAQHGRPTVPGHPILYRNEGNGNNWATIRLQGTTSNRDAIGARVTMEASGLAQTKEVYAGSSHLSTASTWLTFGLATRAQIDRVLVQWPGGALEAFSGVPLNTTSVLVEGEGTVTAVAAEESSVLPENVVLYANYPNPFREATTIRFDLPKRSWVSLDLYDVFGRRVARLAEGGMSAGSHGIRVAGDGLASGVYTYRLQVDTALHSGTLLVIK